MQINKVGVVGAGTMGNGIAQVCATAGLSVVMLDIDQHSLERGLHAVSGSLERLVRKEQLSPADRESALQRIKSTTDYADLADVDLVIEAATEVEKIKLAIIQTLDKTVRKDAIIASNTSSMSITKLAAASSAPNRFIGMHFFNPVPVMLLVELIRGLQTDDVTHQAAEQFVENIKKTAISVKNSAGFAVNRILVPMINEAVFVLQEGITSARDIDEGMRLGCNHVIGPLALADLIGLDTLLSVMEVFYSSFNDSKYRPAPLLREMVEAGYLGRKSGQGFYSY